MGNGKTEKKTRAKKKRKKRTVFQQEVEELDAIWRDVVILKAGSECEICGTEKGLQAHHIFSRTFLWMRFNHKNGVCLCPSHHTLGRRSAHKNGVWFTRWLEQNRREDLEELEKLEEKALKKKDINLDLVRVGLMEMKQYLQKLKE